MKKEREPGFYKVTFNGFREVVRYFARTKKFYRIGYPDSYNESQFTNISTEPLDLGV